MNKGYNLYMIGARVSCTSIEINVPSSSILYRADVDDALADSVMLTPIQLIWVW